MKSKIKIGKVLIVITTVLVGFFGAVIFLCKPFEQPDSIGKAKSYLAAKYNMPIEEIKKVSYYKGSTPVMGEGVFSPTQVKLEYNGTSIHLENNFFSDKLWRDDYQKDEIWGDAQKLFKDNIEFTGTIIPVDDFLPINEKYNGKNMLSVLPKAFEFGFSFFVPANENSKESLLAQFKDLGSNYPKALALFRELNIYQDIIIYNNSYHVIDNKKWADLDDGSSGGNYLYSSGYINEEYHIIRYFPDDDSIKTLW